MPQLCAMQPAGNEAHAHKLNLNPSRTLAPPFRPARQPRRQGTSQAPNARRPLIRTAAAAAAATDSALHKLPDGAQLEVLRAQPSAGGGSGRPTLVFLHGSGHSAWCWKERFMPFFSERGYDCYAVSFRGQGAGTISEGAKPGTLASNAADIASFIGTLPARPVAVSHSFGGLVLQKYLQQMADNDWPQLAGTAFLAAAPPSGNKALVQRIMKAMPLKSIRITWGFITKSYLRSASAAKDLFFSADVRDADMNRWAELFRANQGQIGLLDLKSLSDELPIRFPAEQLPPAYVAGGDTDVIVDVPAVEELAAELGVEPVVHRNMAHDVMLDTRWQEAAESLEDWLAKL